MKTIQDINIDNKNVIIRFDYNVPIENEIILDDTRIIKSLKTLNYVLEKANKVIILSHLGRIKNKEDLDKNTLKPVCDYLSKLLNKEVAFCDYKNLDVIKNNKIIMMENTRFFDLDNNKESSCDIELSKYFASFGDVFINDAFGVSHRENASNVGISKFLPSANGFLIEEEINNLNKVISPNRPFVTIMGGAKVSDKIKIIENLLPKIDKLLIGGALTYTFLKAKGYNIGSSLLEEDYITYCANLLNKYNDKIVLTCDNYVSDNGKKLLVDINDMKDNYIGYDIGNKTVDLFKKELKCANTIFFNGALGMFENEYEYGTKEIIKYLNTLDSLIVIGGGDTINAVNKYLDNNKFIISTGGGASLTYLEGKKLPGIIEE